MNTKEYFAEEVKFQGEYANYDGTEREKYELTLKPNGEAYLYREYHYYWERRDDNYDEQEDTISTYKGTYEIKNFDSNLNHISLNFTKWTTNSTGFNKAELMNFSDKKVHLNLDYIERKWREKKGFTQEFKKFVEETEEVLFSQYLKHLESVGFSNIEENISLLKKHKGNIIQIFEDRFKEYDLTNSYKKLISKKKPCLSKEKVYVHLIKTKGNWLMAWELFDTYFASLIKLFETNGVTNKETVFDCYSSAPFTQYTSVDYNFYLWYIRVEKYKTQIEELTNIYNQPLCDELYKDLIFRNGDVKEVLCRRNVSKELYFKLEIQKLQELGFTDQTRNKELFESIDRMKSFDYILAYFTIDYNDEYRKDFYILKKLGVEISKDNLDIYLKSNRNLFLTYIECMYLGLYDKYRNDHSLETLFYASKCIRKNIGFNLEELEEEISKIRLYFEENGVNLTVNQIIDLLAYCLNGDHVDVFEYYEKRNYFSSLNEKLKQTYPKFKNNFLNIKALIERNGSIPSAVEYLEKNIDNYSQGILF